MPEHYKIDGNSNKLEGDEEFNGRPDLARRAAVHSAASLHYGTVQGDGSSTTAEATVAASAGAAVTVGGVACAPLWAKADGTELGCQVPETTGGDVPVDVHLVGAGDGRFSTAGDGGTILVDRAVTSVTPATGSLYGGQRVTITGTGLGGSAAGAAGSRRIFLGSNIPVDLDASASSATATASTLVGTVGKDLYVRSGAAAQTAGGTYSLDLFALGGSGSGTTAVAQQHAPPILPGNVAVQKIDGQHNAQWQDGTALSDGAGASVTLTWRNNAGNSPAVSLDFQGPTLVRTIALVYNDSWVAGRYCMPRFELSATNDGSWGTAETVALPVSSPYGTGWNGRGCAASTSREPVQHYHVAEGSAGRGHPAVSIPAATQVHDGSEVIEGNRGVELGRIAAQPVVQEGALQEEVALVVAATLVVLVQETFEHHPPLPVHRLAAAQAAHASVAPALGVVLDQRGALCHRRGRATRHHAEACHTPAIAAFPASATTATTKAAATTAFPAAAATTTATTTTKAAAAATATAEAARHGMAGAGGGGGGAAAAAAAVDAEGARDAEAARAEAGSGIPGQR